MKAPAGPGGIRGKTKPRAKSTSRVTSPPKQSTKATSAPQTRASASRPTDQQTGAASDWREESLTRMRELIL